ncbi:HIT family hydrolase [Aureimonas sp. Leaf454]|uniref:HIT family protein n=1 Tax=Aureimonas sp. Leaf454 TaxID=1736381 RepID=UPI0006FEEAC6|nr:HIT family protein [Aureimonas sp. Leaf454]KQT49020.1 HIT family hydrolase [Aureimonas sp. Leaf454]
MTEGYDPNNVFAKILRGEIPSQKLIETDTALAIMDVMPQSKGHCLVIPKAPSRNLLDASDATLQAVMPLVARLARAVQTAFSADGVFVAQFNEAPAGQTVFHLHIHVIPRYAGAELERHAGGMADPAMLADQAAAIRAALESL